ncbi:hypothetical protein Scep_010145 [Stephania cephalantha]|uniref:Uncharacterized protein n=1 Tax=Stephania cephalantha TaxID=152367 RepID=A0AAP0JV99_9MAGN
MMKCNADYDAITALKLLYMPQLAWAMPQLKDRSKLPNIVDHVIKNTMDLKHLYQVGVVTVLCVQPEPSYKPLITDGLHFLFPLVHVELGGTLKVTEHASARKKGN